MGRFPIGASVTVEELAGDPHPVLARLRAREPVSWLPALDGWLVTDRDLAMAVMRDAETFTVDDPRFSTAQVIGPSMLSLDGLDHGRHRGAFGDPFRAPAVREALLEWTRRRAGDLVDEIAAAGGGDLRAELAAPLAIETMETTLDLAGVDASDVLGWYEAIVAAVHAVTEGSDVPERGREAFADLHAAVASGVADSSLLAGIQERGDLTLDEIVSNVAVLLFGGIVTSESSTALALQYLLGDPEALSEVLADRSLIPNAVEEALRLEPSASVVDRYATKTIDLGPASITGGDLVRVSLAAANRDPSVFPEPDRFDVHRRNAGQHVTFARGPHACLGIHLARLETRVAVAAVLDRLRSPRLDPDRYHPPEGLVFRAPPSVHALWER